MSNIRLSINIILTIILFSYSSSPYAEAIKKIKSTEADSYNFSSNRDFATFYFYRPSFFTNSNVDLELFLNDEHLGSAVNKTAFVAKANPGEHDFWLKTSNLTYEKVIHLEFNALKDNVYFIVIDLVNAEFGKTGRMFEVDEEKGKQEVLKIITIPKTDLNN